MHVFEDLEQEQEMHPLELILPVLEKTGYTTGISFEETIKEADRVMDYLVPSAPITTPINVLTGLNPLIFRI
jgi:hypothetical protein